MTETANLQIRVRSDGVQSSTNQLAKLATQGQKTERATDGLTAGFKRLVAPIAAVVSVSAGLNKLVSTAREFDVLNARLTTATGSAENAAKAFEALQDFATSTPYDLQQVTTAFTSLVNYGLNPSEKALTAYGDTAAAMGKDLQQLIEAVADATTGEFERLKEFGIRAASEGDNVTFTFRGVSTTVKKNSEEIEKYLINLGQTNFSGAMIERMNSLDGALSNLGDEWNKVFLNISNSGAGEIIEDAVRTAISALEELNAMIASDELIGYLDAIAGKFDGFADDAGESAEIISKYFAEALKSMGTNTEEFDKYFEGTFENMPENIRAFIQLMTVEFASLVDYGLSYGKAFAQAFGVGLAELVDKAGVVGEEILDRLNPFDGDSYDFNAQFAAATRNASELTDSYFKAAEDQANITRQARIDSIQAIMDEREAAISSYQAQIIDAKKLREQYEKNEEAKRKANEGKDRTAEFYRGSSGNTGENSEEAKALKKQAEANKRIRDQIFEQTRTDAEAHQIEMVRLIDLYNSKVLDEDLFARAATQEQERYQELVRKQKLATDEMTQFTIEAARNIQDALGEGLYDAISGNFDNIGDSFIDTINRMATAAVAAQLNKKLFGTDFDKTGEIGGLIGDAGGALSKFFGGFFAEGGRPDPSKISVVGEKGPELFIPDGVRGQIMPNTTNNSTNSVVINQTFPGITNATGIRETASQAALAAAREQQRALQRNG